MAARELVSVTFIHRDLTLREGHAVYTLVQVSVPWGGLGFIC